MSLMTTAKYQSYIVQNKQAKEEAQRHLAYGQSLADEVNRLEWMAGLPPATYGGETKMGVLHMHLLSVDDVTIGIVKPGGGSDSYYVRVDCCGAGCNNPVWAYISKYSSVGLVEKIAHILAKDNYCEACDAKRKRKACCVTCGKPVE